MSGKYETLNNSLLSLTMCSVDYRDYLPMTTRTNLETILTELKELLPDYSETIPDFGKELETRILSY